MLGIKTPIKLDADVRGSGSTQAGTGDLAF
jgi:hypothetical protein